MKINVIVSVDWEGRDLESENEQVFKDFREKYPEVPMQQFLNAAYLTKDVWTSQKVRAFHENTLRDIDELGPYSPLEICGSFRCKVSIKTTSLMTTPILERVTEMWAMR